MSTAIMCVCVLAIPVIIAGFTAAAAVKAAGKPTPKPPRKDNH